MNESLLKHFFVTAVVAVSLVGTVSARQMLYYYDFDTKGSSYGLYTDKSNKGTGTLTPSRKITYLDWTKEGVFGSPYALLEDKKNTGIWIGDGSTSIGGCSGKTGFTISFWAKMVSTPESWTDFFGFRFGGKDIFFEYGSPLGCVKVYGSTALYAPGATEHKQFDKILTPGEWTHICLVWNFNQPGIDLYIGGEYCGVITHSEWTWTSTLQQLYIGSYVRNAEGKDRTQGVSHTALDDFALFDFSATPDQVRWLGCHHPALPPEGPGRDMPYRFSFDRTGSGGVELDSYGSGRAEVKMFGSNYRNYTSGGAFDRKNAYYLKNGDHYANSIGVESSEPRGLGASIGTGFTFSIWVYGKNPEKSWSDFWGMSVGNRHLRGEWDATDKPMVQIYEAYGARGTRPVLAMDQWNNLCYVWNSALNRVDVYLNGALTSQYWEYVNTQQDSPRTPPDGSEIVTRLEVGSVVMNENGELRGNAEWSGASGSYVDEAALFNYSFSAEEIAEMIKAPPMLPPFVATNLSRTVSADGVWQGFNANWTDGDTTRRLTWPAWEDMDVAATLTVVGDGLALTNDSFVTCTSLLVANGAGTASVRLSVPQAKGAIFEPQALTLGDGVEFALPLGCSCTGALTFGANAKLVIDAADFAGATTAFSTGSFVLPEGETDVLAHTALINGEGLVLILSADGKKLLVQPPDTVPATADWTNADGDGDVTRPGNWLCKNAAGTVLGGEVPQARTVIQLSGNTNFSLPTGVTFPHQSVVVSGDVTLTANCDWRGLGGVRIPSGHSVDVKGFTLIVDDLTGDPIWNEEAMMPTVKSSVAGGTLDVVTDGETLLDFVRFAGSLKLVKSGTGTLTLTLAGQTYTGGTEVNEGTLVYGTNSFPAGPKNAAVKVAAGATLDMNGVMSTDCIYNYDLAGTVRQFAAGNGYSDSCRCFGDITLSGDATIIGAYYRLDNPTKTPGIITFNGHKLTLDIGNNGIEGYVGLGAWRDAAEGGTLEVANGTLETLLGYGCKRTRLVVNASARLKIKNTFEVGGFEYAGTSWDSSSGTPVVKVYDFYRAGAMRPPLQLQDGAGIDLSAEEGVWSVDGIAPSDLTAATTSFTEAGLVSFADSARTITIDIGTRAPTGKMVSWTSQPANLNNLTFTAPIGSRYLVTADSNGIYVRSGMCILLR